MDIALCRDRLDLVDGSYERPGGPEADTLKRHICPYCPLATDCLTQAMLQREEGVWGGTTPNVRTRHGGPRAT